MTYKKNCICSYTVKTFSITISVVETSTVILRKVPCTEVRHSNYTGQQRKTSTLPVDLESVILDCVGLLVTVRPRTCSGVEETKRRRWPDTTAPSKWLMPSLQWVWEHVEQRKHAAECYNLLTWNGSIMWWIHHVKNSLHMEYCSPKLLHWRRIPVSHVTIMTSGTGQQSVNDTV
jgi:hypothetical protein